VDVPRPGPAMRDRLAVRVEVVRRGVRDSGVHDVARADLAGVRARVEVDQAPVPRPPRHPAGALVLAALADGDQHLDGLADELLVLRPGDLFDGGESEEHTSELQSRENLV